MQQGLEMSMSEPPGQDRRKHKRIHFIKEVEVIGVGMRRCTDLCSGGMYLETVQSFPEDSLVELRVKLRDTDELPVRVQARVIYVHKGMGAGLCFINLKPGDRERIERFIQNTSSE